MLVPPFSFTKPKKRHKSHFEWKTACSVAKSKEETALRLLQNALNPAHLAEPGPAWRHPVTQSNHTPGRLSARPPGNCLVFPVTPKLSRPS
jgi:hypothetical protein